MEPFPSFKMFHCEIKIKKKKNSINELKNGHINYFFKSYIGRQLKKSEVLFPSVILFLFSFSLLFSFLNGIHYFPIYYFNLKPLPKLQAIFLLKVYAFFETPWNRHSLKFHYVVFFNWSPFWAPRTFVIKKGKSQYKLVIQHLFSVWTLPSCPFLTVSDIKYLSHCGTVIYSMGGFGS